MIDGHRRQGEPPATESGTKSRFEGLNRRVTQVGTMLVKRGVTADQVTVAGMCFAIATAVVIGTGYLYIGIALLIVGGLMDTLDGVVAKVAGATSPRGAFFDSVADRVSDAFIFGGVTWYLLGKADPRAAIIPVAILGVSGVISYTRAKAESLGFSARGGLMERAERLILLGLALLMHMIMVPLLVVLLLLTGVTAVGRFIRVWRQASAPLPEPRHPLNATVRWRPRAALRDGTNAGHRLLGNNGDGSLVPLTIRLRGVLRPQETGGPRPRRGTQRRERRTRASFRRPPTDY
jgi:CDP-diacylglycerol--glycerol-3-phosphate 3-phosphatidyltransferase